MRRLPTISLVSVKFVQAFAAGLRAEFADAVRAPLPKYLAALMRGQSPSIALKQASFSLPCPGCPAISRTGVHEQLHEGANEPA
jgi:hypothetical protein